MLRKLLESGYRAFCEALLEQRRESGLPPFSHLAVLRAVREYVFDPNDIVMLADSPWIGQTLFYGAVIAPSFALAWVSWRVFEAPILALKARFPY